MNCSYVQQRALVLETQDWMEEKQKAQDYIAGAIFIKLKIQQNLIKQNFQVLGSSIFVHFIYRAMPSPVPGKRLVIAGA